MRKVLLIAIFAAVGIAIGYQQVDACCGALYPPIIENLSCDPDVLWPPNHKYWDIMVTADVSKDPNDPYSYNVDWGVVDVVSNQPDDDDGIGDGETTNDCYVQTTFDVDPATGQGFGMVKARAERCGETASMGVGRTYTIVVRAYARGSAQTLVSEQSCQVFVPHDLRGGGN